jgi:glutathione S-transferase
VITLFEYAPSGNCYKVRLILTQLGLPFERVAIDTKKGETRTAEFLRKNPNGKVPVVQLDDGTFLPESNAILWYFAEGTPMIPSDRLARAHVLQWMFFEQYSHEPYIAVARNWISYAGIPPGKEQDLKDRQQRGYAALDVMEKHLASRTFFAGDRYSIADIALYAYTHVAHEGEFQLSKYSAILGWLERVKNQPKHITIDK